MSTSRPTIRCASCNRILSEEDHHCPICGSERRQYGRAVGGRRIKPRGGLSVASIREFYQVNRKIKYFVLFLLFLSVIVLPVVWFFLSGVLGIVCVVISAIVSGLTYFLSPYAVKKVREIRTLHSG
jgi:predicted RNA-binding Zn-ribbon protein involved in translation (DUF1610 family)